MTKLSVNVNKIALLRNTRNIGIPNVLECVKTVIIAGSYGVTVHPRPDQRHIKYADAYEISELLAEKHPDIEFNIEGNPFTGKYIELISEIKPDQATLVPDSPDANTSDHGWDLKEDNRTKLEPVIKQFRQLGIRVSLFMDPEIEGIEKAKEIGADRIELYTEPYASAFTKNQNLDAVLGQYVKAGEAAADLGLGLNAGHDLNLKNLGRFCEQVGGVLEVSIGHALIADALEMGLYNAVKEYLKILS